jgi:hypothetical protein
MRERGLVRQVKAKAMVSIEREDSRRELSRDVAVRVDMGRLRSPGVSLFLARPDFARTGLPDSIRSSVQTLLRGIAERILVGPVLRRIPLVRRRVRALLRGRGRAREERAALGNFLELAAVTGAAAGDPSKAPLLLVLVLLRPASPDDCAAVLNGELATLLIADAEDRVLLAPGPPAQGWLARLFSWWPGRRGSPRWRRRRILRALSRAGLRLGDPAHNAGRFVAAADYLDVVNELTLLFLDLVPQAPDANDNRAALADTEDDYFSLLLDRLAGAGPGAAASDPAPDLTDAPHLGGFNPGSYAPPPPARTDLARWYWNRAPILEAYPELKIRKLDRIERDVVGLQRVETREAVAEGRRLDRPLRHRPFHPADDDPADVDFSQILISADAPIVDCVTFGVGRAHPAVPVPVEKRWTTLRECKRREIALVEIEFDVAKLAIGSDLFDQILFIRDSSGSMGGFGSGTPLDCVTLGVFSVMKTLEARGLTRRFKYGAIDFSNSTQFSGYVDWDNRAAFERVLLTQQNGGTTVDMNVVHKALSGTDRTLVLFLSDGALEVRGGTTTELVGLLAQHQTYVVASAGSVSNFCRECADARITTLLLDRIEQVGTVFTSIATRAEQA